MLLGFFADALHSEYFAEFNEAYLAYMLATIGVESYDWRRGIFFAPVQDEITYQTAEIEYGSGPVRRKAAAILNHNTEVGDGYKYRGRGLVQIAWKINYEKFKNTLGIDFVNEPELALDLENTTRIMLLEMRDGLFSRGNTLADVNSDGKVTADELRETLRNPEFRDRWSKRVVRHHTEWQTQSDGASLRPFRNRLSDGSELPPWRIDASARASPSNNKNHSLSRLCENLFALPPEICVAHQPPF